MAATAISTGGLVSVFPEATSCVQVRYSVVSGARDSIISVSALKAGSRPS